MSTLKVNKLRDTAGSTDAITLDPNGGAVLAGVTTVSTVKVGSGVTISSDGDVFTTGITTSSTVIVGSGVTISESGIEASGIGITCANINGTQIGGRRNLIQNGSFIVHQRSGTTTSPGFLLDRWYCAMNGGTTTFSQGTETSGTVYEKGLVNYCRITNTANSTVSSAYRYLRHAIEAQNLLKSGWNYKSASAKITLSFYVRSSVAQNFYGYLRFSDNPDSKYVYETGSLTADTWTKVTKVIPGYTSGNIDNDNGSGMEVLIAPFWGTNFTDSGVALNTWAAWNGDERAPDYATTWAGTNGATFDVTGFQLEVGPQATPFEHRSFGEELSLCQRYFYRLAGDDTTITTGHQNGSYGIFPIQFPQDMRAQPTGTAQNVTDAYSYYYEGGVARVASVNLASHNNRHGNLESTSYSTSNGTVGLFRITNSSAYIDISAEL